MKGIIFSDLHAWMYRSHSKEIFPKGWGSGINSRFYNSLKVLNQIYSLVVEHKCDFCVFIGDLVRDGTLEADMVDHLKHRLLGIGEKCLLYMVTGNHDIGKSGRTTILSAFEGRGVQIIRPFRYILHELRDCCLVFLPYSINDDPKDWIDDISENHTIDRRWVFFYHWGLGDIAYRGLHIKSPLKLRHIPRKAGYNFFGHIHDSSQISDNALYVGASQHIDEGDFGRMNYCVLYDTSTRHVTRIPLKGHRFIKAEPGDGKMVKNHFVYFKSSVFDIREINKIKSCYLAEGAFDVTPYGDNVAVGLDEKKYSSKALNIREVMKNVSQKVPVGNLSRGKFEEIGLSVLGKVLEG